MSQYVIGIDEVGRGPVAGPLVLCAVKIKKEFYDNFDPAGIFDSSEKIIPLRDSKKLSEKQRLIWSQKIKKLKETGELDFKIISIDNVQLDKFGLSKCIKKSIEVCLDKLSADEEDLIKLDGSLFAPTKFLKQETIIKGDEKESVIALASIIAKVSRDNFMVEQSKIWEIYEFHKNKGYGTKKHLEMIKENGICPIHRLSFLKNVLG